MNRAIPLAKLVLGPLMAAPGSAMAQQLGQGEAVGPSAWRVVIATVLCLLLAALAALALRARMQGGATPITGPWLRRLPALLNAPRRLRRLESIRVGQQVEVCLFECGDRSYLIAATSGAVTLLKEEVITPPPAGDA